MTDPSPLGEAPPLERLLAKFVVRIVQRVAELPDRTSPDDWPEAMLVTGRELADILYDELEEIGPFMSDPNSAEAPPHNVRNKIFELRAEGEARRRVPRFPFPMNPDDHQPHCAILTTRDGWDADCTCGALVRSSAPPQPDSSTQMQDNKDVVSRVEPGATLRDDRIHADTANGDK